MSMPDNKFKIQALGYQKFEVKNILRGCLWYMSCVTLQGYWVICRFCCKEQRRQPVKIMKYLAINNTDWYTHHVFRVPIHDGVFEIESLQIGDSRRLHFFRKLEQSTKLRNLRDVEFDKQYFFICSQKGYVPG